MAQVRIGIQLASLRQPVQRGIVTAAKLGADAVQFDARTEIRADQLGRTGVRQLRKYLDDCRLRVASLEFRTRRGYAVEEDLERRVEATKQALTLAYDLGAQVVINSIGRIPDDESSSAWKLLVEVLSDIGQHSHRCGAQLAADTGYDDPADLLRLIQALPPASLAVHFNPATLIQHGFPTLDAAQALGPHIVHVQARDANRDRGSVVGREAVPLGSGSAAIPEIMGILDEFGFRGFWTVDAHTADPERELKQAIQFLRGL